MANIMDCRSRWDTEYIAIPCENKTTIELYNRNAKFKFGRIKYELTRCMC